MAADEPLELASDGRETARLDLVEDVVIAFDVGDVATDRDLGRGAVCARVAGLQRLVERSLVQRSNGHGGGAGSSPGLLTPSRSAGP